MEKPKIGMIGIGQLGLPIAVNLMRAGFDVVGYRRTDRANFERQGGIALDSPRAVAEAADVILLCLPNSAAQAEILEGPDGILLALKPAQTVIELATYPEDFKRAQADRIEARGGRMLEVEVSGSPPMIAARKGVLYIGGEADLVDAWQPVLEAISERQFHIGPLGSAVGMKLISNNLLAIHTLAAAEAINLGRRAGYNPLRVAEVISQGSGSSAMFALRGPWMATRTYEPAPGPFNTLEKYLHMGLAFAESVGGHVPLLQTAAPYFLDAIAEGRGDQDIAAVVEIVEARSSGNDPHVG